MLFLVKPNRNKGMLIFGIVLLIVVWVACRGFASAGRRSIALSAYARQLPLSEARKLHDYVLRSLVHASARERGSVGKNMSQQLEIVAALRDWIDECENRPCGPANKVNVRTALARATSHLVNPGVGYSERAEVSFQFSLGEDFSNNDYDRMESHAESMRQVYENPA
jgi:hypothetical protein